MCSTYMYKRAKRQWVQQRVKAKSVPNQQERQPSSQHVVSKESLRAFCPGFFVGAEPFYAFYAEIPFDGQSRMTG